MNQSKKGALLGLAVMAGLAYGCKDFLTVPPQGSLNELSLGSRQGVEATLIGAYRMLGGLLNWGSAPSGWAISSVASDDAYKGSDPTDQGQITDLELYNWTGSGAEDYLNQKWNAVYEGVTRANSTLRLLDQVTSASPAEIPTAEASSIRGEALFLRAHYHFEAWRTWGNIPYYKEDDTDFRKPNAGSDPVPLVLADLDEAIANLPDAPYNNQAGRVSKWTAMAYKGMVQLYNHDYAGALTTLTAVKNSGNYALESSFDHVWTGFSQWENGKETILAYEASANDGEPSGNNANFGERLNFPHSGSPFGCCGFHQPSQNLVNFYKVDPATGLPLAIATGAMEPLDATASWNAQDTELAGGNMTPVDPRLDWTVGRDSVPFKDWGLHMAGWIRDPVHGGPYSPKKNIHEKASGAQSNVGWVNTQLNSVNIHIFRYADMLLMLAEAEVEAGSLENARAIVNQIRTRAMQTAQGCGLPSDPAAASLELSVYPGCAGHTEIAVPINDPSIKWAKYQVGLYNTPWTDQAYARTAVHYERRLELGMEAARLWDLRRWNEEAPVLNNFIAKEKNRRAYLANATTVTEPKYDLYPIPAVQIELSKVAGEDQSRLTQNPGW